MNMTNRLMVTVIAVVLALSLAAVAITVAVRKSVSDDATTASAVSTTAPNSGPSIPSAETTTPEKDISREILGKWVDSTGMSGYDFHEDGTVDVTYVNLTIPVINIPINGSARGAYKLAGDQLEVHFSIYTGSVDVYYTATITDNSLILVDKKDNNTSTYMRPAVDSEGTTTTTTTSPQTTEPEFGGDDLIGQWRSSDNKVEYTFFENATVTVRLFGKTTAEYTGVYIREGENSLTLQYTAADGKVTNTYSYEISGLSMKLTDTNGETILFVKTAGESESLIGKWQDSSKMSGFEFKENGVVSITYINLTIPVVNIPISGKFDGTYSVSGNVVTINYSAYSNAMVDTYYYTVSGSTLKLVNVSDGEETNYIKV